MKRARIAPLSVAALAAVILSACGDEAAESSAADTAAPTSEAPAETASPSASSSTTVPSNAAFPVTIEHKFGTITIDSPPERVVSIGFAEHDGLLSLGVQPVAVRDWYGDQPYATWPWAIEALGDAQPEVLPPTALNFEQIASLNPDLIVGVSSGMTDTDYETLSAIAPTLAQTDDWIDYGTPWDEQLRLQAVALGKTDVAEQVIADVESKFAAAREAHPEFEGATAAVAFMYDDQPGAYASGDIRAQTLADLGFVTPPEFDELAGESFYFSVSQENIDTFDTDVIVWITGDELALDAAKELPLRHTLTAYEEGREVFADALLSGAFSHGSPFAFDFIIESLVPQLAAAIDGDPATTAAN